MSGINRLLCKIRSEGVIAPLRRRLRWYEVRIKINNRVVGRMVELLGDNVRIDGMSFSVKNAAIETQHKSVLFFGLHELDERALVERWLPRDAPVVEFGGGLGVVSSIVNRRLDHPEWHVVVEANPGMIAVLEQNRARNGRKFKVLNRAVDYESETVEFAVRSGFVGSKVATVPGQGDTVSVPSISLRRILDETGYDQITSICDIEGAEVQLVTKDIDTIRDHVRVILLETHPQIVG